ncbi:MAG: hypothetical protein HY040_14290 [Planctomycetes bacterium]|nr:hypothetical protein [Planctomycetota bacterium]
MGKRNLFTTGALAMALIWLGQAVVLADSEDELLLRFQTENRARLEKLKREAGEALNAARRMELEQARPEAAAALLQTVLSKIHEEGSLPLNEQRALTLALKRRLTEIADTHLLNIPKGERTAIAGPGAPPAPASASASTRSYASSMANDSSASPAPPNSSALVGDVVRAPAALLFYDGVQHEAIVHQIAHDEVRCTINGQGLKYPSWQLAGIRVREGLYFFHYQIHAFVYLTNEEVPAVLAPRFGERAEVGAIAVGAIAMDAPLEDRSILAALWRQLGPTMPHLAGAAGYGGLERFAETGAAPDTVQMLREQRSRRTDRLLDRFPVESDPELQRLACRAIFLFADRKPLAKKNENATVVDEIIEFLRTEDRSLTVERADEMARRVFEEVRKQWERRPL